MTPLQLSTKTQTTAIRKLSQVILIYKSNCFKDLQMEILADPTYIRPYNRDKEAFYRGPHFAETSSMHSFSRVNKGNLNGCIKFCRRCIYVIVNAMNNSVCTLQKCLRQNFGRFNWTNCVRNVLMVLFWAYEHGGWSPTSQRFVLDHLEQRPVRFTLQSKTAKLVKY